MNRFRWNGGNNNPPIQWCETVGCVGVCANHYKSTLPMVKSGSVLLAALDIRTGI